MCAQLLSRLEYDKPQRDPGIALFLPVTKFAAGLWRKDQELRRYNVISVVSRWSYAVAIRQQYSKPWREWLEFIEYPFKAQGLSAR